MPEKEKIQNNVADTIDVEDAIAMTPDFFGPLLPYIENEEITDIDYNGTDTWIRTCHGQRYREDKLKPKMTKAFINRLTSRIQTSVSKEFNPQHPLLEAETKVLRISIVHESRCNGRRSICIRKTPTSVRIDTRSSVESGYASPELLSFLKNAVKAHFNLTICGEPGVGKTEFAKYVSLQIPDKERVITIEDNLEWHYHELKPTADCVEMQVSPQFTYFDAIKACLRQNPNWIMVSEVRGKEVANYLQQLTTGVHGITTLHTGDVSDVPDRLCNMAADTSSRERIEGDIFTFLDIAVLVDMVTDDEGLSKRRVSQVAMFFNDNGEHKILRVFDNGILIDSNLPIQVMAKFNRGHVENPFINEDIVKECEGLDLSSLEPLKNISSYVDPSVLKASQIAKEPTFKNAQANNMDSQMMMYQMMQMMQSMANNSGNVSMQNPASAFMPSLPKNANVSRSEVKSQPSVATKNLEDKRKYKRYSVNNPMIIQVNDETKKKFKVMILNVSKNGIGLLFSEKLPTDVDFIGQLSVNAKPVLVKFKIIRSVEKNENIYYGCSVVDAHDSWDTYIDSLE